MIESGAGESSSYSDKEYSDAGAEVTKDTAKVFGCPMILKRDLPPEINDEQPDNPDLIDPIKNDAA
jgi:alanine dehydrogenase